MIFKVKKLHPEAKLPSYAHPGDAGMDLFALETVTAEPGKITRVRTGIATEFSDGYVALFWDKGGLSINHGLKLLGGVLDAGYRGELVVGLINLLDTPHVIEKHHKVAQLLLQAVERPAITEATELSDTSRGAGGFGSTGK